MRRPFLMLPVALTLMAANGGASPAEPPAVVALTPMAAMIVDGGQVQGLVKATVAVTGDDGARLEAQLPAVRAAVYEALNEHARLRASPYAAVDAAALAADLTRSVHRAVPTAKDVLLIKVEARAA